MYYRHEENSVVKFWQFTLFHVKHIKIREVAIDTTEAGLGSVGLQNRSLEPQYSTDECKPLENE